MIQQLPDSIQEIENKKGTVYKFIVPPARKEVRRAADDFGDAVRQGRYYTGEKISLGNSRRDPGNRNGLKRTSCSPAGEVPFLYHKERLAPCGHKTHVPHHQLRNAVRDPDVGHRLKPLRACRAPEDPAGHRTALLHTRSGDRLFELRPGAVREHTLSPHAHKS